MMYFTILREPRGTTKKPTHGEIVCFNHHKINQKTINTDVSETHIIQRKNAGPEHAHERCIFTIRSINLDPKDDRTIHFYEVSATRSKPAKN